LPSFPFIIIENSKKTEKWHRLILFSTISYCTGCFIFLFDNTWLLAHYCTENPTKTSSIIYSSFFGLLPSNLFFAVAYINYISLWSHLYFQEEVEEEHHHNKKKSP